MDSTIDGKLLSLKIVILNTQYSILVLASHHHDHAAGHDNDFGLV